MVISQTITEISRFFDFQDGSRPSPWICEKLEVLTVTVPNFMAIGQTAAQIWQLFIFFKMVAVRHLGRVERVFGKPTKGIW